MEAQQTAADQWATDKFSMFIHYGPYSEFGGMWQGDTIKNGYSEQILSFGVHFSDWYEEEAGKLSPSAWQADSIVSLAKAAGMRSIVFTSKHHDGFCMYETKTTTYNIVDSSPDGRDPLAELARACHKGGLKLGIYFSLIDWHLPAAMPISSHNADIITPDHHRYNMRQVRELLTQYGPISEFWFDMGSLLPDQSKELYKLVHELQPSCRVSGRLGNGYSDFAVMADNTLPDGRLDLPWQTAASMYRETWGYRSWQKRISDHALINEKIQELVRVVSRGGNYLLNIGPRGDGSIVDQEQAVLREIGRWLAQYGEAIYNTRPYEGKVRRGDEVETTRTDNALYIFVPQTMTEDQIELPPFTVAPKGLYALTNGETIPHVYHPQKGLSIPTTLLPTAQAPWIVLKLIFDEAFTPLEHNRTERKLSIMNAKPSYANLQWDYYTGYNAIYSLSWKAKRAPRKVTYAAVDSGQNLRLVYDGHGAIDFTLSGGEMKRHKTNFQALQFGEASVRRVGGIFGYIPKLPEARERFESDLWWQHISTNDDVFSLPTGIISSIILVQDIQAKEATIVPISLSFGNGFLIELNGKQMAAELVRNNDVNKQTILLPLERGVNRIVVKFFNRYDKMLNYGASYLNGYTTYTLPLERIDGMNSTLHLHTTDPAIPLKPLSCSSIIFE